MAESTPKTVYFLGAGASHASEYELPCMEGFFREDDFKEDYPNLLKFIKRTFSGISLKELNLEEVITFLELALDTFGSFGEHPEAYMIEAKREFGEYVKNRLHIPSSGCREHKKIFTAEIAASYSQDSIITLNYDLVIDNTLHELWLAGSHKNRPSLLHRMRSMVGKITMIDGDLASIYHDHHEMGHYLKLHGSVDWMYCSNNACGNHQFFLVGEPENESSQDRLGDLCDVCGSPLVSVIVPPTTQKTFSQFPKLGLLWSLAYRELNKADRIVIFGVSIAPSDYYLRWLLKKAVTERENKPTIVNIDIDERVPEKIEKVTGESVTFHRSLDKFLKP